MSQLGQQEPLLDSNYCSARSQLFLNLILGSWYWTGREALIPRSKLMRKALTRLKFVFRLSWMRSRSSWIAVSIQDQWFHGHAQALPNQDLDCVHLEGFIHNSTQIPWILLGSLKCVLTENRMIDTGEIIEVLAQKMTTWNHGSSLNPEISWWNLARSAHSRQNKRVGIDNSGSSAAVQMIGNSCIQRDCSGGGRW